MGKSGLEVMNKLLFFFLRSLPFCNVSDKGIFGLRPWDLVIKGEGGDA